MDSFMYVLICSTNDLGCLLKLIGTILFYFNFVFILSVRVLHSLFSPMYSQFVLAIPQAIVTICLILKWATSTVHYLFIRQLLLLDFVAAQNTYMRNNFKDIVFSEFPVASYLTPLVLTELCLVKQNNTEKCSVECRCAPCGIQEAERKKKVPRDMAFLSGSHSQ